MNIFFTIFLSTFKFAMTFPLAIFEFRFSFLETILWINIGGIMGIYFFAYLSEGVNKWIQKMIDQRRKEKKNETGKTKKLFTKRNRRIITIKQKYGLPGIALTTPLFLSIPVGVFLAVRYYPRSKTKFFWLIGSNLIWSLLYTSFYMFWKDILIA